MPYLYEIVSRRVQLVDGEYIPVYEFVERFESLRFARVELRRLRENRLTAMYTFHLAKIFSY
jgi:hypothetical protein